MLWLDLNNMYESIPHLNKSELWQPAIRTFIDDDPPGPGEIQYSFKTAKSRSLVLKGKMVDKYLFSLGDTVIPTDTQSHQQVSQAVAHQ